MKKILSIIFILLLSSSAFAKIRVVASYHYIADIAKKIGKDRIKVIPLAPAEWDPHYVVPKPSLIAKVRRADLLIINGVELEIGWIPPIIRESKNSRVQPGASGFLDLSAYVQLIDVPKTVSRRKGNIHPSGNPHFHLDPNNIPKVARAICMKLCKIDSGNCLLYKKNLKQFNQKWMKKIEGWNKDLAKLKGKKVVQYHKTFDYLYRKYGINCVIELEPLPGIPPTSKHIKKVIDTVKSEKIQIIINDLYHSKKPAEFVAGRTGAKVIVLPVDVNSVEEAKDIFALFDEIVRRLTK